jgi:hypothetical protein
MVYSWDIGSYWIINENPGFPNGMTFSDIQEFPVKCPQESTTNPMSGFCESNLFSVENERS